MNEENKAEIEKLVSEVAMAAIKFQDLKNTASSGYVFDLQDFAKFEGKTGPYIQYAIARINSVLRKASENNIKEGAIFLIEPDERTLALKLAAFENTINRAAAEKEPSIIADYAYNLAQIFSSFYNTCPMMTADDAKIKCSRLALAKLVRNVLKQTLYLLGISSPDKMLKANN